jgi:hypothetical protein
VKDLNKHANQSQLKSALSDLEGEGQTGPVTEVQFEALMKRLLYFKVGRTYTRDEMNER